MQRDDIIQVLKRFKRFNADRYNIVRLGLFGSRARDICGEESDIDVVVVLSKPDMFNPPEADKG